MTVALTGGPILTAIEVDAYRLAAGSLVYTLPHGTGPHGALSMEGAPTEATTTLRASDTGYRTKEGDVGGLRVFPPSLTQAVSLDRRIMLSPDRSWAGIGWGEARFRHNQATEAVFATHNSDGRDVRLYVARKTWDSARRIWLDPAAASLDLLFKGLAGPWRLDDYELVVPLRDPSYWFERPLQQSLYAGTGTYEGPAELKGLPKPQCRGGSAGNPLRNVGLVCIDPANLIYQYNNAAGTVVTLYEGGYAGYVFQANVSDLYVGTTNAGQYRTDNARGLIQLGTQPQRIMTADVTGAFPVAGAQSVLANVIRYTLTEDLQLPAGLVDTTAFAALAASINYVGGYWQGATEVSGVDVISYLMSSIAAFIVPTRAGTLKPWALRALAGTETPAVWLDTSRIISAKVRALAAPLDPPPYRWRVGYRRNHVVQGTDVSPLVTEARKAIITQQALYGSWSSSTILSTYRRPSDPNPVGGALTVEANATAIATALGALFGAGAQAYDIEVPIPVAMARDIGEVIGVSYPIPRLRDGRLMQIVGERIRPGEQTAVLEVFG